jgi:hypothetical protein
MKFTMARSATVRGVVRRLAVSGAALATVGASVTLATSGATNAADAASCTVTSGSTSNLATGPNGVHPTGGTIFTKGSVCHDLNVIKVSATDSYEGWLQNSHTGVWSHCSAGFVRIPKGNAAVVLCSGVLKGTQMAVVQESSTKRTITAEY